MSKRRDRAERRVAPQGAAPPSGGAPAEGAGPSARRAAIEALVLACVAAVVLLWDLGERYLWQDEAATAVLADRMLRFGRPLAYDGVNLVTIDHFVGAKAEEFDGLTTDPAAAVAARVRHGETRADTAWTFHPWGQFVLAGAGIGALGRTTVAARLPFALAGIATVLLLHHAVRRRFGGRAAVLAAALLVLNPWFILHARQCRYYALSMLLVVVTVLAYLRWRERRPRGALCFVSAAWLLFQVDYGTVWPLLSVLGVDALLVHRREIARPLAAFGAFLAAVAPFVWLYRMWDRGLVPILPWTGRLRGDLNLLDGCVAPLTLLAAAAVLVARRRTMPAADRALVAIACAAPPCLALWAAAVGPSSYLRYLTPVLPLGCVAVAWVLAEGLGGFRRWLPWCAAAVVTITPWASLPYDLATGRRTALRLVRPGIAAAARSVFGRGPDPNRIVVEWLRAHAAPTDEILVNYEDVPLIYYLPNPIRGGIAAFRAEDDRAGPPAFAVIRNSVPFTRWDVFNRIVDRWEWSRIPTAAPDVVWGNNPDPFAQLADTSHAPPLVLLRRVPSAPR